jgi:hypothetical protein
MSTFGRLEIGFATVLLIVGELPARGADGARLYPDVALRYSVGDPQARNPINNTEGPKTLAAGDMNGDGLADVVAGNLDGSVSVLLGRPTTNGLSEQILTRATGILSNSSFRAVAIADFNGDGRPDVVAGDISRKGVVTLLGNGDGTLTPHVRKDLGPVRALAVADFDRNGQMDLLAACSPPDCDYCHGDSAANTTNRFLCVLKGNGDGTFAEPEYLLTRGVLACFYDVEAADLNGDGYAEAVSLDYNRCVSADVITRARRVQIFANDGHGAFATNAPARVLEAAGEGPRALEIAYVDEQIDPTNSSTATLDIIVINRDSATIDIFLNSGGLDFSRPRSLSTGDRPRDLAVGDLDGDGYSDFVVVDRDASTVVVMRGRGGGRFDDPNLEYPTGVSPRQVVLADINGDGALDAAVNNRISEDISLFLGKRGLAGFLLPDSFYPTGVTPVSLEAIDFNRDGYPDVATANLRSHDVRVRLNRGDGTLGEDTPYAVNREPAFLASGDLNLDGHVDLVVTCLGSSPQDMAIRGSLVTLLGRGDGTFSAPLTTPLGHAVRHPYWLRLGDLDNDGALDAVIGGLKGELVAFRGLRDGTFKAGVALAFSGNGRPLGFALGDFDRNEWLDIATSRGIVVLNEGQFFAGTNHFVPTEMKTFNAGTQAWAVEANDLDGDGILDLMIALTFVQPDPIGVSYGLGDGTFTQPDIYEGPDVGVVALAATDVDGDAIKDIVVGNRCAATVIVMRGIGNRKFEYKEIIHAYSVEDVAVADLNRDGRPDVIGVGIGLWVSLNGGAPPALVEPQHSLVFGAPARDGLFINEIMSLNATFHVTNGYSPDWVEIYNYTALTQDLNGWTLTQLTADGDTNRWTFPPTNALIAPMGHLVVYCKKKVNAIPGLQASFELSSDGENLSLLRPDGAIEDSVEFPALPADVSFARFSDGARFFGYNPVPTFGSRNRRATNLEPSAERKDPYVGPGATTLGLNARFFDDVAIAYAAVCYRVAGAEAWQEIAMNDDGQHGDKESADGYYGAILPTLPAGTTVEYYLRVVDLEGQSGSDPGDLEDAAKLHRIVVPQVRPALRLTELVAANSNGLRDERNQAEDWVELLNTGSTPANLGGMALSRDYFDRGSAWNFPSNHWVQPGQRVIVFCDEDAADGPLHASFKLTRTGDRVFLIETNTWTIVDSLSFGPLPTDTSFGVLGEGAEGQWLAWPTPSTDNLGIPPRRHLSAGTEMYWRISSTVAGAPKVLAMRWLGIVDSNYTVTWSDDLVTWQATIVAPNSLGEGLYEWSDVSGQSRRFYRIR